LRTLSPSNPSVGFCRQLPCSACHFLGRNPWSQLQRWAGRSAERWQVKRC
jgi:hypothetical protein